MKRKIYIALGCIILIGLIIVATIGFNVDLKYKNNKSIIISLGQEFNNKDIKNICKEIYGNKRVIIEKVELYEDIVEITVNDSSEEQNSALLTKINEKYGLKLKSEDLQITDNAKCRLRTLLENFVLPVAISFVLIIIYLTFIYKRLGIADVLVESLWTIVGAELLYFSAIAIARIPINMIVLAFALVIYAIVISVLSYSFNKRDKVLKNAEKKKKKK